MKKAKIMLTSLAVLAVVGGALAFKAKTFGHQVLFTGDINGGTCLTRATIYTTTTDDQQLNVLYTTTTAAPVNCQNGFITTDEAQ